MMDREKVIRALRNCSVQNDVGCQGCPYFEERKTYGHEWCTTSMAQDVLAMLKKHEVPTELKQKMWNSLYAEEDEYEKKFVGKEEHLNWFTVYRPWLQKGFDIAINTIADWEGR